MCSFVMFTNAIILLLLFFDPCSANIMRFSRTRWRHESNYARSLSDTWRPGPRRRCPCANDSLCKPISGPPVRSSGEVYGFLSSNSTPTAMNWTHVSTVAWSQNDVMTCAAHAHGSRALLAAPSVDLGLLKTVSARLLWVKAVITQIITRFVDGVVFDYESPLLAGTPDMHTYSSLVSLTRKELQKINPSYQVSVCVAYSPDDIDGRAYNYTSLAMASDLLYVMDYDVQSQITNACIASANSPISTVMKGIHRFLDIGVPKKKLILGVPWYGYRYACLPGTKQIARYCPIQPVPFRGAKCSDAAYVFNMNSPFFNSVENGTVYQYWFDDAESLALKYSFARSMYKYINLGGIGPFTFDMVDPQGKESQKMWSALDVFFR
eukprot:GSMAST32.ASY1.ANO1.866.1 assembled CDS